MNSHQKLFNVNERTHCIILYSFRPNIIYHQSTNYAGVHGISKNESLKEDYNQPQSSRSHPKKLNVLEKLGLSILQGNVWQVHIITSVKCITLKGAWLRQHNQPKKKIGMVSLNYVLMKNKQANLN